MEGEEDWNIGFGFGFGRGEEVRAQREGLAVEGPD